MTHSVLNKTYISYIWKEEKQSSCRRALNWFLFPTILFSVLRTERYFNNSSSSSLLLPVCECYHWITFIYLLWALTLVHSFWRGIVVGLTHEKKVLRSSEPRSILFFHTLRLLSFSLRLLPYTNNRATATTTANKHHRGLFVLFASLSLLPIPSFSKVRKKWISTQLIPIQCSLLFLLHSEMLTLSTSSSSLLRFLLLLGSDFDFKREAEHTQEKSKTLHCSREFFDEVSIPCSIRSRCSVC